ncbi:MAG: hypothetical protein IT368_03755, partial [Candidatus Hydrogenedentes bacterium]|nr:hypothetical protein [Candidatus Hydrogenedentota bacterium]
MPIVLTAVTALSVAGALLPVVQGGSLRLSFLYAASTGFLLTAVAAGAFRWMPGRYLLMGLACCWIGDVAGPHHFQAGALAFASAHIIFAAGFLHQGVKVRRLPFALTGAILAAAMVLLWLWPYLKAHEFPLVVGYSFVISIM